MPFEKLVDEFQLRGVDVLLDAAHGPGIVPMDLAKLDVAWVTGNCHNGSGSPKYQHFYTLEDKKKETKPLTISHVYSGRFIASRKIQIRLDWQGNQRPYRNSVDSNH